MEDFDFDLTDMYEGEPPTLYDINKSFDVIKTDNYNGIVGEEEARMVVFTNFVLGEKPVILKGSRASGKCLEGNTPILLDNGIYKPIKDIVNDFKKNKTQKVKSFNQETMLVEDKKILSAIYNGRKKVYKITTSSRREIILTSNHRMLQYDGYKSIDDGLQVGDSLLIHSKKEEFGNINKYNEAAILGYFVAEGGLTGLTPYFTNADKKIVSDFKRKIRIVFGKGIYFPVNNIISYRICDKKSTSKTENRVRKWLNNLGVMYKYSYEKTLPPEVFEYNEKTTRYLLRALFSCDGTIYNKKSSGNKKTTIIEYCTSSPILAQQIQTLLGKFGIISTIRNKKTKRRPTNILTIYSTSSEKYLNLIGFTGEKAKRKIIPTMYSQNIDKFPKRIWDDIYNEMQSSNIGWKKLAKKCGYSPTSLRNSIKYKPDIEKIKRINQVLNSQKIASYITMGEHFFFDEIKSIEYVGEKDTYDIEVEDNHNFIANSFVSHNSNILRIVGVYAKNPVDLSSSSEKAYKRMSKLNEYSHFFIPEINKVHEGVIEMLKDFGEGAPHEYSFTNPYKEVETIRIEPKPFITSIADENKNVNALGEELLSRLTVARTDSGVEQNKRVIIEKLRRAQNPNYKKDVSQKDVERYKSYVHSLPSIKAFDFIYPAGEVIMSAIPPIFTDSRRDTDKYLANTYGITLFHYIDRMKVDMNDKEYMLVTPADIWYNHIIYENVLLESALKCGRVEKEIIKVLKDQGGEKRTEFGDVVSGLTVNQIHSNLLEKKFTVTIDSITKMCNALREVGYLSRNDEVRPYRFEINPALDTDYSIDIDWQQVVDSCKEGVETVFGANSPIAKEYINRFCTNGLEVVHPFTGEKTTVLASCVPNQEDVLEQQGVLDAGDSLQQIIINKLGSSEKDVTQLISEVGRSDEETEKVINYLKKVGSIIEVRPGILKAL